PVPSQAPPTRQDVELLTLHAMVERHLGNYRQAQALLETGLARLPAHSVGLGTPLRLELATVALLRRAFPRSQALAEAELRTADGERQRQRQRQRHLRMDATIRLAHCCAFAGDVPALLHWAREAGSLVDSASDADISRRLDALSQLTWAETLAERHHD